jgi:hypothetical protein
MRSPRLKRTIYVYLGIHNVASAVIVNARYYSTPHPRRHRHTCLRTSQNVPSNLRSKSPSISSLASTTKISRASQYDCISLLTAEDPCNQQFKCLCTSSNYITGYRNCIYEYCDAADISSWIAYAESQCAGMPLTIRGSIGVGIVLTEPVNSCGHSTLNVGSISYPSSRTALNLGGISNIGSHGRRQCANSC